LAFRSEGGRQGQALKEEKIEREEKRGEEMGGVRGKYGWR
jgi:hypothetical protein